MKKSLMLMFALNIQLLRGLEAMRATDNSAGDIPLDLQNTPTPTWSVVFSELQINLTMTTTKVIEVTINDIDLSWAPDYEFHIVPSDEELLHVMDNVITVENVTRGITYWRGNFTIKALFLGHSPVYVELRRPFTQTQRSQEFLDVIILRKINSIDKVFNILVAVFVTLMYVNFGAVIELDALKRILIKPVGPAIGFVGQFVVMPVLSFFIGYFLFRDKIEMRLGLFFIGSTPGGGASNIFTVLLNGNLNLSITMTAISNLAAFGMMPLWIFTLGALIFKDGNLIVPYKTIATMAVSLVIPLAIGLALQKCTPNLAKRMSLLLKPVSLCYIVFVTAFTLTANAYMFKLCTWKILIASSALPWMGYFVGWTTAVICRQTCKDALTIAIETGIQNIGIALFMLNFSLPQPQADMTTTVVIAYIMTTPIPLTLMYVVRKIFRGQYKIVENHEETTYPKDFTQIGIEASTEKVTN